MRALLRRIGFYLLTAVAAVTVDFFIPRVMPGNPVDAVLARMEGQVITKATLHALELQFGANTREGLPGQVAVTGFDDIPVARHLRPPLTTVRQAIQDLGATAFEVLHAMISRQEPGGRDIVLPARLVLRESCGCLPAARPPTLRPPTLRPPALRPAA